MTADELARGYLVRARKRFVALQTLMDPGRSIPTSSVNRKGSSNWC